MDDRSAASAGAIGCGASACPPCASPPDCCSAATHGVSGGDEIRRSDAPRLVDLVREAQQSVDRLTAERDAMVVRDRQPPRRFPRSDAALAAITRPGRRAGRRGGPDTVRGPGLVVTLNDAQRDAQGRFPRDASPDDLVVHQQDIQAVLNALWSAGAEGIQMQDQRIIATSAPRCVGNTLLLNGRTYSPPYVISAIGDAAAMQAALSAAPMVTLYKQYAVRFGLGYTEEPREVDLVGLHRPVRMSYAQPDRSTRLLARCGAPATLSAAWKRAECLAVACADAGLGRRQLRQLRVQPGPVPGPARRGRRGLAQRRRAAGHRGRRSPARPRNSTVSCSAPDPAPRNGPAPPSRWCTPAPPPALRCWACASDTRPSGWRSAAPSTARPNCCTARPAPCTTRTPVC